MARSDRRQRRRKQKQQPESRRTAVLATLVLFVLLGLTVADFLDNGHVDNGNFLVVSLFIFSGAGAGRALDSLVDRYIDQDDDGSW